MLYVKDHLNPIECEIETLHEVIGVSINSLGKKITIILVYRPPHQQEGLDEDLYALLAQEINNKLSIIMGDLNAALNWDSMISTSFTEGNRLLDFVNNEFLHQWVDKPTRGNNILDIVLSTEDNLVSNLNIGEKLGNSDHNIIRFQINIPQVKVDKIKKKLDYRRGNFNELKECVKNLEYNDTGNIDIHWESFLESYTEKRSRCIPLKQVQSNGKPQPKWFNREILNKIKERDRAHKAMNQQPTLEEITSHK